MAIKLIFMLMAHFVADFLYQDSAMMSKKSTHLSWQLIHAGIYSVVIFLFMVIGKLIFQWEMLFILKYISITLLPHIIIDYFSSRNMAGLWEKKSYYRVIMQNAFEQFLHSSVIIIVMYWLI